ncbi:hypothetical protein NDU88_000037 [Pleurodeles waltl]|uniref:Uncharacterized protein n=1 Tax=Pleurodeles waltl TaxID=8319 RepID=A0AAV7VSZ3_PLEWA|nr:hypothetical protein NDU88_000037 [Pleurodeles waltl]
MGLMREDHKKLKERVEATESNLASLRSSVLDATVHIRDLQKEVVYLLQQADDQEGRSCHNNVCIVGLQERIEAPAWNCISKNGSQKHSSRVARERTLVIAEVEQREATPSRSLFDQEHMDDDVSGADQVLADALLDGGPQVIP